MMFNNINMVHVYYATDAKKLMMGRLALKQRKVFFEYDDDFLKTGLELSPFKLPLKPGVIPCQDTVFDGLFGVFNDSQPDGWGRLLLDRKLIKQGVNPGALSPLDRLCYVGCHGMGALIYEPEVENTVPSYSDDLDEIAEQMLQFQEHDADQFVDELLALNGSSAGARPKILVNLVGNSFIADAITTKEVNSWIIKFRSSLDAVDISAIEYAYHLMAQAANLNVPDAKLFHSKKGPGYFGVKRFDRNNGHHLHMHTLS
jgi:serine/threonine-protein kinase HipA